ncbi:MAG: hypothetical protein AAGJ35_11425, partial [Myxococcota bacterium]
EQDGTKQIELTHKEASLSLRLSYAIAYPSVHGRTVKDSDVVVMNTEHNYFTVRHLVVGLSRVTQGCFVDIPTLELELNV